MLEAIVTLRQILRRWWSEFTLQTRLMAVATLVVSLLTSGLTFWAVNTIQQDARLNDTRFGRDLGLLLAANTAPLVAEQDLGGLAGFSRRFYNSTSSVRYLLYADVDGDIFYGIPFSDTEVKNSLTLRRRIQLPPDYAADLDRPLVRQHLTPNGQVTDVFVPLTHEGQYLGVLAVGTNPNPTVVASSGLTRDVTIAVFVSIWVMVILGAVFNALTITKPIKELLIGVKNIASGDFKQRITLPFGGELGELIASFNDMAERLERYEEQNIEELTASKAKLETLIATIVDGALLLDTDLRVVLVNPTARQIFGWDRETDGQPIIGRNVLYEFPPEVQVKLTRPLYQLAEGKADEGEEFRITLMEPVKRTVRILLSPVLSQRAIGDGHLCDTCEHHQQDQCSDAQRPLARECNLYADQDGEAPGDRYRESIRGIAVTVQDITREVELNEAKSQFISNVSHELRTPLFNIKSFIETLHDYGDELSPEQQREFLDTANRETDRLTRLVNDVLDLSRLESSRSYTFDAIDLVQPIEQTLRTYQLNARDKGIELTQELAPSLPPVLGNYDLLLQVFANLVGNALKFTPKGGQVAIRAYIPQDPTVQPALWDTCPVNAATGPAKSQPEVVSVVRVEVADTGIGIGPEDCNAIFDRFYRVENRVHTLEGTGLGLSIVRNIIDKHQSSVKLISEVGVGTIFWFDLLIYRDGLTLPEPMPVVSSTLG
ncbi:histidine kinase [Limnothrix sp. PR1529]|uniref:HAMP domain-containing sensor histidine kinase n=1 Tax=Limnothrix sp. PR1529 TaxID=1704291 RepID=UPI00081E9028|nr:HAMP domain-containing sensor histidine kinase [Limnothrix sp. PR1529]OCQ93750.1 PAS domain-containing sensor histidine kinase [Limnothrix sp. P13C2]PIB05503.1 histidine kinase [Limnothrix sp. PR1529]